MFAAAGLSFAAILPLFLGAGGSASENVRAIILSAIDTSCA